MKIVEPCIYLPVSEVSVNKITRIERCARVCYKSEPHITDNNSNDFVKRIITLGHTSVIEHEKATVLIVTDRGISHEIVRHRIGSYSQESTRYCNYSRDKFGNQITVIKPFFYDDSRKEQSLVWEQTCKVAEEMYFKLIKKGQPQEARSVLPNSLKTEIVVTYNFREWRHFFGLRCSSNSHPQMRQIAIPLLLMFKKKLTGLFEDIDYDNNFPVEHYAKVILTDNLFNPILSEEQEYNDFK